MSAALILKLAAEASNPFLRGSIRFKREREPQTLSCIRASSLT